MAMIERDGFWWPENDDWCFRVIHDEVSDLDAAIAALQESPGADILQVQRLKKRKLQLRDRITFIEDQLTPDIIA